MINEQASHRFHIDWDAVQCRNELAVGSSGRVRRTCCFQAGINPMVIRQNMKVKPVRSDRSNPLQTPVRTHFKLKGKKKNTLSSG